jgi:hypothetical protein
MVNSIDLAIRNILLYRTRNQHDSVDARHPFTAPLWEKGRGAKDEQEKWRANWTLGSYQNANKS